MYFKYKTMYFDSKIQSLLPIFGPGIVTQITQQEQSQRHQKPDPPASAH